MLPVTHGEADAKPVPESVGDALVRPLSDADAEALGMPLALGHGMHGLADALAVGAALVRPLSEAIGEPLARRPLSEADALGDALIDGHGSQLAIAATPTPTVTRW